MEIAQEKRGAVSVMGPVGRLDTDSAADLELAIQDMLAAGAVHYVVDLEKINYVSSAGLRVLLMLAKSVDGGKGSLRVAGLNAQVQQVFDIAGFTKLFQIYPDRDAALRDHPAAGQAEAPPPPAPAKAPAPEAAKPAPAKAAVPEAPKPAPEAARPAPEPPKPAAPEAPKPAAPEAARPAPEPPKPVPEAVAKPAPEVPKPAPEPPKAAPAPPPPPPLAAHAARLLGAGPAPDAPIDAEIKALARHAAMLLGVKLDGGAAPAPKAAAPKPAAPAPAPEPEAGPEPTEEKGGFFGRLFGKRKRTL